MSTFFTVIFYGQIDVTICNFVLSLENLFLLFCYPN